MAAQDVRELVPGVKRAIDGPAPATEALTDDQALALAADCIADIILLTSGQWGHTLAISERDANGVPTEWSVEPALSLAEERLVAAQAALQFYLPLLRSQKVGETITNEGQTWSWQMNGAGLRDYLRALIDQRDKALAALEEEHPVLAQFVSVLQVRDPLAAAVLEPWVQGGLGGGLYIAP